MPEPEKKDSPKPYSPWHRHFGNTVRMAVLLAVAVGGYWLLRLPQRAAVNPDSQQGVGRPLPFLELQPLTGDSRRTSLDDLRGRVTLLNFWGTWCGPCREEIPHLAGLRERYAGQKAFRLLAVSYPADNQPDDIISLRDATAALLGRLKIDVPTYFDPNAQTLAVAYRLTNSPGFPTTLLLDRHGVIRAVWIGYWPGAETEMEQWIGDLLDEHETPADEPRNSKTTDERKPMAKER
jgi:thiol-disulfide isomerase/thioredoxin